MTVGCLFITFTRRQLQGRQSEPPPTRSNMFMFSHPNPSELLTNQPTGCKIKNTRVNIHEKLPQLKKININPCVIGVLQDNGRSDSQMSVCVWMKRSLSEELQMKPAFNVSTWCDVHNVILSDANHCFSLVHYPTEDTHDYSQQSFYATWAYYNLQVTEQLLLIDWFPPNHLRIYIDKC